ncbi:dihydroxyacetone kinase subunit DhaL [Geobacillus stearothermophilus]|uniref:dihydroxyacetone kinase subunit DhaL n=1 Tax=Geobacillus thermoleovorans TaxID=33941 RepID=UPI0025A5E145|nr:dihydroxyacetone kinase subunit DhaL [Geobacillus stearothermophilus]
MKLSVEQAKAWIDRTNELFQQQKQYLTELDQAIGDGDHGLNMARGFQEAVDKISSNRYEDVGTLLKDVAMTLIAKVGGASGPLYGTAFLKMSQALAGRQEVNDQEWIAALEEALAGLKARGKAQVGEKTMIDVWEPVVMFLREKGRLIAGEAAQLAKQKMEETKTLEAKKGRAAYLGKRSIGHIDPGSASSHLLFVALAEVVEP